MALLNQVVTLITGIRVAVDLAFVSMHLVVALVTVNRNVQSARAHQRISRFLGASCHSRDLRWSWGPDQILDMLPVQVVEARENLEHPHGQVLFR